MPNKTVRINISGVWGIVIIVILIALGFLALTFFFVFIGILAAFFLIRYLVRRLMASLGVKRKQSEPIIRFSRERMIETPEYKVEDDDTDNKEE